MKQLPSVALGSLLGYLSVGRCLILATAPCVRLHFHVQSRKAYWCYVTCSNRRQANGTIRIQTQMHVTPKCMHRITKLSALYRILKMDVPGNDGGELKKKMIRGYKKPNRNEMRYLYLGHSHDTSCVPCRGTLGTLAMVPGASDPQSLVMMAISA